MNESKDIKAIIVCCASTIELIQEILLFMPEEFRIAKKEILVMIPFQSKRVANNDLAYDFLKPGILNEKEMKQISNGKKNEFNINGVNISIRVKNEMDCFIRYYQRQSIY